MSTLALANEVQATLWELELAGQLSDGHWENSRPYDHWKPWCRAEVIVDPNDPGRDFSASKDTYQFCSKQLLDVVGQRMVRYARLCKAFGRSVAKVLEKALDLDGEFRGPPTYPDHGVQTYWSDARKALKAFDMAAVRATVEDEALFTHKDLIRELKEIKRIIKIHRRGGPAVHS